MTRIEEKTIPQTANVVIDVSEIYRSIIGIELKIKSIEATLEQVIPVINDFSALLNKNEKEEDVEQDMMIPEEVPEIEEPVKEKPKYSIEQKKENKEEIKSPKYADEEIPEKPKKRFGFV